MDAALSTLTYREKQVLERKKEVLIEVNYKASVDTFTQLAEKHGVVAHVKPFFRAYVKFETEEAAKKMIEEYGGEEVTLEIPITLLRNEIRNETLHFAHEGDLSKEELLKIKEFLAEDGCYAVKNKKTGCIICFSSEEQAKAAYEKHSSAPFKIDEIDFEIQVGEGFLPNSNPRNKRKGGNKRHKRNPQPERAEPVKADLDKEMDDWRTAGQPAAPNQS